jgi:NADH-quinone oxidoreductase subunit E
MSTGQRILTEEMTAEIEALAPRYPDRRALTLPALHVVNRHLRHVPLPAVVEIAELLGLAPAEVQDTLSFYGFFPQDQPHGETRVWVCRSLSCALRGGEAILDHMCGRLGIRPGETTSDQKVTVEYAECLGACEHAPCMLAGDDLHKNVDTREVDEFIDARLSDHG